MNTIATFASDSFLFEPPDSDQDVRAGADVARWLRAALAERDLQVDDELGREDFGWTFEFHAEGLPHCAVIGGDGDGRWYVAVERSRGLLGSLLGQRNRDQSRAALAAVHAVLSQADEVDDLAWIPWSDFRRGALDETRSGTPFA